MRQTDAWRCFTTADGVGLVGLNPQNVWPILQN